jgi:hypothetical protein
MRLCTLETDTGYTRTLACPRDLLEARTTCALLVLLLLLMLTTPFGPAESGLAAVGTATEGRFCCC